MSADAEMAPAAASSSSSAVAAATGDEHKFRFSIDRGGTFTDVYAELPVHADGSPGGYRVLKLLSEDPASYSDAPREAIRRVLESVTGVPHPIDQPLDTSRIGWIRMGTTVATNALLERKGERTAFLVTRGFKDLLHIGNQSRAKIFDLEIARPDNVYERVVEVDERVMVHTPKEGGKEWRDVAWEQQYEHARGVTGEEVLVLQAPDLARLEADLRAVLDAGIRSLAVSLAHSYTFPRHEQMVGELAKRMGFTHISLSSSLMPMIKLVPRSYTACADAYLTPCIHKYLTQFRRGFDAHMERNTKVWFMQSDGGLVPVDKFSGFRAVLSGPAGGVVGYAQVTPIKPKSERALAQDAQASAAARRSGQVTTGSSSLDRSIEDRFNIAQEAVIGFDMGGTSTDVSRYSGRYEHIFENQTAGITIQAPQLDINTVAAGGGSMLFFKNGLFVVGPDSAGAHPGPASYRKGGPLTITDANLFLGRLLPEHFPKIFGPHQDQPLDAAAAATKFEALTAEINAYFARQGKSTVMGARDVALGFVVVANEAMCRPIRALTQSKGYDIQRHTLSCFGGAGGQHAAAIARNLGLSTIFLHRFSGILSAYGLGLANIVQEVQEPCTKELNAANMPYVLERIEALKTKALRELSNYGFDGAEGGAGQRVECQVFLNLRYTGTDTSVMTTLHHTPANATAASVDDDDSDDGDDAAAMDVEEAPAAPAVPTSSGRKKSARASAASKSSAAKKKSAAAATKDDSAPYLSVFVSRYQREYGFTLANRAVIIDDIRVRGIGHSLGVQRVPIAARPAGAPATPPPAKVVQTFFEADGKASGKDAGGRLLDTAVYLLSSLHAEDEIRGPAMVIDNTSTTLIEPGCTAKVTLYGDLEIYVGKPDSSDSSSSSSAVVASSHRKLGLELDNIQLSIFSHRFMSIAEQMGRTLQRTSISTNIKERLDFSCALFGPDGGLVANAPHLPVHLGALQEAVKFQLQHLGDSWTEGQVIVSNHPQAGGSHLPDITVITPVFSGGRKVFFVASRGHHADIGGISPGSMPPFSKRLYQEGARIVSFKLVSRDPEHPDQSLFDEKGFTALLQSPGLIQTGPDEPKCVGTRCLSDNLADGRAQVAANQKGIKLMEELIAQYSLPVVQQYMTYIQVNAEEAVREMLRDISSKRGLAEVDTLVAEDFLDDGSRIKLSLTIDRAAGSAIFDFTGTSPEVYSNTNAPPAVTYSAIIYCLRCQVKRDIPLNQGCLNPIEIRIPKGCFLNPSSDAAVVGGNVLTSQRVTDVVLRAFEACAASQGCMNNFTFGDETFGYYETIAGGAGGGPTWDGQSGVHTHMTNTRITDPEILERRYPVLLREFSLRAGSGGAGLHAGGCGIIREVEFLRPLDCGILSERRVLRPYGLAGGAPGKAGKNFIFVRERAGAEAEQFRNGSASEEAQTQQDDDEAMQGKGKKKKAAPAGGSKKKKGAAAAAASSSSAAAATPSAASAAASAAAPVEYTYRRVNLGGKNTYKAAAHDRIRIVTPGGGGWGVPTAEAVTAPAQEAATAAASAAPKRKLHEEDEEEEDSNKKPHIASSSFTHSTTTVQRGAGGVAVTAVVETVNLRTGGSVSAWQSLQEQA